MCDITLYSYMNVLKESEVTVLYCKNIIIVTFIMHFENLFATSHNGYKCFWTAMQ
jgi:hypothetical protein